jgi:hypothetical protein
LKYVAVDIQDRAMSPEKVHAKEIFRWLTGIGSPRREISKIEVGVSTREGADSEIVNSTSKSSIWTTADQCFSEWLAAEPDSVLDRDMDRTRSSWRACIHQKRRGGRSKSARYF